MRILTRVVGRSRKRRLFDFYCYCCYYYYYYHYDSEIRLFEVLGPWRTAWSAQDLRDLRDRNIPN